MIIDIFYFNGITAIEGMNSYIEGGTTTNDSVLSMMDDYIRMYEPEYISKMFGGMEEYIYGLFGENVVLNETEKGLKALIADEENKTSPISGYVFFNLVKRNGASASPLGAVKPVSDEQANPTVLLVQSWNFMCMGNRRISKYIENNISSFPDYKANHSMLSKINALGL